MREKVDSETFKLLLVQVPENVDGRYIDEIWDATWFSRMQMSDDEEIKHFRKRLEELKRQRGIE